MARIKHVSRHPPRDDGENTRRPNRAAPTATSGSRATASGAPTIYTFGGPVNFPSLPTNVPEQELMHEFGKHGLELRVRVHQERDTNTRILLSRQVDEMYNTTRFPEDLDGAQKAWYTELNTRWLPGAMEEPVS